MWLNGCLQLLIPLSLHYSMFFILSLIINCLEASSRTSDLLSSVMFLFVNQVVISIADLFHLILCQNHQQSSNTLIQCFFPIFLELSAQQHKVCLPKYHVSSLTNILPKSNKALHSLSLLLNIFRYFTLTSHSWHHLLFGLTYVNGNNKQFQILSI